MIVFPGSNCDTDVFEALQKTGFDVSYTWHQEVLNVKNLGLCVIPGGFSYGDYLRSGAIAASLPIMQSVREFANEGGNVIGICNGFQILTEAKLLRGALVRNSGGNFICKNVRLKLSSGDSKFTAGCKNEMLMQVAHADGRYICDEADLRYLKENDMIAFEYLEDVNGSTDRIAGVFGGVNKNILGMMPHPERSMASEDGMVIFQNILNSI